MCSFRKWEKGNFLQLWPWSICEARITFEYLLNVTLGLQPLRKNGIDATPLTINRDINLLIK